MNGLFEGLQRDQHGALILGSPDTKCPWCGASAAVTYSGDGKIAWWHAPTDCCDRRISQQRKAFAARHADERAWQANARGSSSLMP